MGDRANMQLTWFRASGKVQCGDVQISESDYELIKKPGLRLFQKKIRGLAEVPISHKKYKEDVRSNADHGEYHKFEFFKNWTQCTREMIDSFTTKVIDKLTGLFATADKQARKSVQHAYDVHTEAEKEDLTDQFVQDIIDTRKEFWDRKKLWDQATPSMWRVVNPELKTLNAREAAKYRPGKWDGIAALIMANKTKYGL